MSSSSISSGRDCPYRLAVFPVPLSLGMVEDMLAARGILGSHQTVRLWAEKFGRHFAKDIRKRSAGRLGDKWHLDEAIITIAGKKHWLWRAVDQDGFVLDVLVQSRRNARTAKRLMQKLLKSQGHPPRAMITDKLRSYCRWLTERARRSRRTATRVSPAPISQTSFARAGRAREAPEPCSCTIGAQPAARSLISYASVACTSVETRA